MAVKFNYKSSRAVKARLAASFHPWVAVCEVGAALLLIGGIALLVIEWPLGWALIGFAPLLAMIAEWYYGELRSIDPSKGESIDALLDSAILGRLSQKPSPYDIAGAASYGKGGQFFVARFGIGPTFLQQLVSNSPDDADAVWQEALKLKKELGLATITGGALIVALVRQIAQRDSLLAHLQLDEQDLVDGIIWYERLQQLIEAHENTPKNPGGIGRDWSFGWIPTLSRFGTNISEGIQQSIAAVELEAHKDALAQVIKSFENKSAQSIALVGQTGVGKTEVVYALAKELMNPDSSLPSSIKYHQVFLLDASSLVAAAPGRGELEGLVTQILGEAYAAKNIVVCLDNAQLFFEEGVGSVDLTSVLLPILQAGRLPIILTIDEQRYLQISQRSPELANSVQKIMIAQASAEETMRVMQDQLITYEFKNKVTYMYQALKEAYRLSERYIYDLAMPGRALRLLETAAQQPEEGLVTARSVQQAIEKTSGVKVGVADTDAERDKLLHLEENIHKRMIGQERAVTVVSEALRRARAGVRNQARPIGTFLFLGPTGVGKTELAKSLAAVYFGNETQMIRLDMNEFVSPDDVRRLIADGAKDPGSLTAQAMKQPFSVVLLDEIEKAHPTVLTTLLQLLDEGILRDENNKEVSFRDTIVIATSNAGAERIREYIERGYTLDQFEEQLTSELINSKIFRPEFLNRFDEMVVFSPLLKENLIKVVDLILAGVNRTLEPQKISVAVSDEAKAYLVEAGYDPRLGARPMRRVVQKAVENTVATEVIAQRVQAGGVVEISLDQVKALLDSHSQAEAIVAESKAE